MKLDKNDLREAVDRGILDPRQADRLWALLTERHHDSPHFSLTHILYYFGGMIAIGAMSLFMTLGWERFGGLGLTAIALAYAAGAIALLHHFLYHRRLRIPAGLMAAFVVVLTPLAIYGLQVELGYWSGEHVFREFHTRIDWAWLLMELGTLAVAAIMLWRYRMPFSVMPLAVVLWYLSMDLAPMLFAVGDATSEHRQWQAYWEFRKWVSMWFGLAMLLLALLVDLRARHAREDFAFWLYLFGVLAFWGGLSLMESDSELARLLYLAVNLLMIGIGAALSRRVFVIFGALGTAGYLGHLAHDVFEDSVLFPFVLTLIGLAVIGLGIVWQRHEADITRRLRAILPNDLRELLESRRA
jgi:hypothetical protein